MSLVSQFLLASSVLTGLASGKAHTVSFSDSPVWTVGAGVTYADMNITLGKTVSFTSMSSHDVVLVHPPDTGVAWDHCSDAGIAAGQSTSIFASSDFTGMMTQKHYTPPTCGDFYLACSMGPHCKYGQRIKVTVMNTDDSACSSPCVDANCVTDKSKVAKTSGLNDVKPEANSNYWGTGPFSALTVEIGDTVVFKTGAMQHDVATVPSLTDFDDCVMTSKTVVADWAMNMSDMSTAPTAECDSSDDCCAGSSCGVASPVVTYTWTATTAGDQYIVCSKGTHCKSGQKIHVTVKEAMDSTTVNYARQFTVHVLGQLFVAWVLAALW